MSVLIAVDIPDLLCGSRHLVVPAKVIEEHKSAVEVNPFKDEIGYHGLHKCKRALVLLKFIIKISNKGISGKQMLIVFPLVEHLVPGLRLADGIQHIAVALAVDRLLEGLDGQA